MLMMRLSGQQLQGQLLLIRGSGQDALDESIVLSEMQITAKGTDGVRGIVWAIIRALPLHEQC
jgi:hypothetical protein